MTTTVQRVNYAVVQRHAEEAAFLWTQRDRAVASPSFSLRELTQLDDRIEGHLDGLALAKDVGRGICLELLALEEPGEVFVAAALAVESSSQELFAAALEVALAGDELSRPLISALGWVALERAQPYLNALLQSGDPRYQVLGLAGACAQRVDPGGMLIRAANTSRPRLHCRGLRALAELGRCDMLRVAERAAYGEEPNQRFWGAWAATLLGSRQCISSLQRVAVERGPGAEQAADLAVRAMAHQAAVDWHAQLAGSRDHVRVAIVAAGALGEPALMAWLIRQMGSPEHARLAGAAFAAVTGVDLENDDLDCRGPEGADEDDDAQGLDTDLPWPDPSRVAAWWSDEKARFTIGRRYVSGKLLGRDALQETLRDGTQPQRASAALELALQAPGQPLFDVRAPAKRQVECLAERQSPRQDLRSDVAGRRPGTVSDSGHAPRHHP